MSKPYDAATKRLIEMRPIDWVRFFGLPIGTVTIVDADLSTVSLAADRLLYVDAPTPYYLHPELESRKEGNTVPGRLLRYNVNAEEKVNGTVLTAVVLLRKEADSPAITGRLSRFRPDGSIYLSFEYMVARIWQLAPETLLAGGLSLLPFAPIANVQLDTLPTLIRRMDERFEAEAENENEVAELWTATNILMGLRYDKALKAQLLQGVKRMRDSITYQEILEEGEGLGQLKEARRLVLKAGVRRLGPASAEVEEKIAAIDSVATLEALLDRIFDVESWSDLLG